MVDILKTTLGFVGVLLIGILGVIVSETMQLGDPNTIITTVDNVAHVR